MRRPNFLVLIMLTTLALACGSVTNLIRPADLESETYGEPDGVQGPKGALSPGESSKKQGIEIILLNPTFSPGCKGEIGFEFLVTNTSNEPISGLDLFVTNFEETFWGEIWWEEGNFNTACYSNSSGLSGLIIEPGESMQLAIRVQGDLPQGSTSVIVTASWDDEKAAEWAISTPLAMHQSCRVENWEVVPTAKYEHPMGDGWKLVIVELAVANRTPYWARFNSLGSNDGASLTTEDGYTYRGITGPMTIPETNDSPYSGEHISGGQIGGPPMIVGGGISTLVEIPPGFALANIVSNGYPFSLMFRVAESQKQYIIMLHNPSVSCILPDGSEKYEDGGPIIIRFEDGFGNYTFPTDRPDSDFRSIPSELEVLGKGKLEYLGVDRSSYDDEYDLILLQFKYTSETGYDTEGRIEGYLIGDDGILVGQGCNGKECSDNDSTWFGSGYFGGGPGQTRLTDIGFLVDKRVADFKFVWIDQEGILPGIEAFNLR